MAMVRKDPVPEGAISDEAAAYVADVLMELALEFESKHFGQIRRHYESLRPEPCYGEPQQLEFDLFDEYPPF